jgi:hypothetical protein
MLTNNGIAYRQVVFQLIVVSNGFNELGNILSTICHSAFMAVKGEGRPSALVTEQTYELFMVIN